VNYVLDSLCCGATATRIDVCFALLACILSVVRAFGLENGNLLGSIVLLLAVAACVSCG
jgi:hypothetical protein